MLNLNDIPEVYICCGYTDLRKSSDGYCSVVETQLPMD